MKLKFALLLLSCFLFRITYSENKKGPKPFSFKVNGSITNFQGKTIYLHHKWDDKDFTDSALIVNGQFEFALTSAEPNMYWFTLTNNIAMPANVIFFADKFKIKVRIHADSLSTAVVAGGPTQTDYLAYRALQTANALKQQELQSEFTLASQKNDRAAVNQIQLNYQELGNTYMASLKNFIKTHPKSAVSGYIIYRELSAPAIPIENAVECLGYLDKSIENTKFVKLASKKINDVKGTVIGAQATDFSQNTADGTPVKLSDFRGKYVLVDFWASWCRPCRLENPNVVSAYNKYNNKKFTVLGVSLDSNKDQWMSAIQNDHLSWTNVTDLKGGSNDAALLYGIQNIPQNVLIDPSGKIIAKNLRGPALDEKLNELLNK